MFQLRTLLVDKVVILLSFKLGKLLRYLLFKYSEVQNDVYDSVFYVERLRSPDNLILSRQNDYIIV